MHEVLNTTTEGLLYLQLLDKEFDVWHKLWFHQFLLLHTIMLILIVIIVKYTKKKKKKKSHRSHDLVQSTKSNQESSFVKIETPSETPKKRGKTSPNNTCRILKTLTL